MLASAWLFLALTGNTPARHALAWADRLYQGSQKLWIDEYNSEALEAYRAVRRRFGSSALVDRRLAECLTRRGDYKSARKLLAHSASLAIRLDLTQRIQIKARLNATLTKQRVLRVEPLPVSHDWAVLIADPRLQQFKDYEGGNGKEFTWSRMFYERAEILVLSSNGHRILFRAGVPTGSRHNRSDEGYACVGLSMRSVNLGGNAGISVWSEYLGGDSGPNELNVFELLGHGLNHVGRFWGESEPWMLCEGKNGPCAIAITSTWKVWWPDVYQWSNGAFRIASQNYPAEYPWRWLTDFNRTRSYFDWEVRSAIYAIHGNWRAAAKMLRRAEYLCRGAIRSLKAHPGTMDDNFPDFGFYGDTAGNLVDIRKRLRWLKNHDYNHALLYRPYDFDLQVPPYKLGHAADGWER